ncbi:MAG: hypothetical protein MR418_05875 [Clostridiales bacterium]|nr:hypothetical protein [Clostridiales bacterium]
MKSSFMRKITALFVAVMMLLPMAAQAEEAGSGYYEASVSDLIVNYMGTQLDFTGLTLKLLGGVDANNKNAIAGLTVGTPDDSKISIAAELGEKDATVLLANQLVTIPYDRMGDALAKLGAETDEEFSDLTPIMDSVWAEIAGAVAIGAIDSDEPDTDINFDTTAISELMSEVTADVTPTDAERTINEVTYAGTEAVVDMTAEQANKLIAGIITTVYGNEQVVAAMESVGEAFTSAAAQSGEDIGNVDFSAMYTAFVDNAQKMTMPNGLKMTVFAATAEDGTSVTDIQIERCTIDMKEYIGGMMESLKVEDAEVDEAISSMDFDLALSVVEGAEADFVDMASGMYLTGAENSFVDVYLTVNGGEQTGYANMSMNVTPAAMGEEGDAGSMSVAFDWDETDDKKTINGSVSVFTGNVQQGEFGFNYAKEAVSDSDDNVSIALTVAQGSDDPMPLFTLGYDVHHESDDTSSTSDVVFSIDVGGAISATGKLSYSKLPMGEDKLMSTNAASALNLADATDEEVQTLLASVQSELTNAIMSAVQVPGIATLMTASMGGEATSVDTTNEAIAG